MCLLSFMLSFGGFSSIAIVSNGIVTVIYWLLVITPPQIFFKFQLLAHSHTLLLYLNSWWYQATYIMLSQTGCLYSYFLSLNDLTIPLSQPLHFPSHTVELVKIVTWNPLQYHLTLVTTFHLSSLFSLPWLLIPTSFYSSRHL